MQFFPCTTFYCTTFFLDNLSTPTCSRASFDVQCFSTAFVAQHFQYSVSCISFSELPNMLYTRMLNMKCCTEGGVQETFVHKIFYRKCYTRKAVYRMLYRNMWYRKHCTIINCTDHIKQGSIVHKVLYINICSGKRCTGNCCT